MAFGEFGLRAKILFGIAIPMTLLLFLAYVSVTGLGSIRNTEKWVQHTHNVLEDAHRLLSLAVDMETGMRGYLLAGKSQFLEPYHSGRNGLASLTEDLKKTVSDNPAQVKRLEEMESVINQWQVNVAEQNIELRRQIGDSLSTVDLAKMVGEARGKSFFDQFRDKIGQFIEAEQALLETRQKEVAASTDDDELRKAIDWVVHTYKAIGDAKDILTLAIDMETGMRGYLLAGKAEFLEPYNNGSRDFFQRTTRLAQLVSDNPPQVQLINQASDIIKKWQAEVVEEMIGLRREIGDAKNMEDMADLIAEAKGKTFFDRFRALVDDFVAEEEALMEVRTAENEDVFTRTNQAVWVSIIAALALSLIAAFYISNIVLKQVGGEPNQIANLTERVAAGDLTMRFKDDGTLTGIYAALRTMVAGMRDIANNIGGASVKVTNALSEISAAITTQTSGAAEQAAAISETTSTLEEIKSTSSQTLDKAESLGGVAVRAREEGERGIQATGQTVEAMRAIRGKVEAIAETNLALSEQTKQIGEITGVVNNLSQQSKMLALNASIEAAKAGEAGKGFAVVAAQIGNLAEQSEESTVQVQKILENILHATDRAVMATEEGAKEVDLGVGLVNQTGETMESLNGVIRETSVASDQIVAAVRQEAAGIKQIADAMSQIEQVTSQFVSGSEQTQKAIEDLEITVGELNAGIEVYQL